MPKIYTVLSPLRDMDDIVAFIFTGPNPPAQDDYNCTPLLVRCKRVLEALEWLKLNHHDYADLGILYSNLKEYPEHVPPVVVDYQHKHSNKYFEMTSVHDMESEDGTRTGICPLTFHGITSEQYLNASTEILKAVTMLHLTNVQKFIAIGHAEYPESIWKNTGLCPQMFPWLFPYGISGIGDQCQKGVILDATHKRHLLMYNDK